MDNMDSIYKTTYDYGEDEIIIKKSRFIGYSKPVKSEDEALEFIEEIQKKHRDATHNVYAYVLGNSSQVQRFSDDGEPSGTAGIPVLEVIKKEDLRNVVVVATRYFGGVKLGGGGLIRAYTRTAKLGLEAGKIVDMVLHQKLRVDIEYGLLGMVENFLINEDYLMEESTYGELVSLNLYIKIQDLEDFKEKITDMTSGSAVFKEIKKIHIPTINGKSLAIKEDKNERT